MSRAKRCVLVPELFGEAVQAALAVLQWRGLIVVALPADALDGDFDAGCRRRRAPVWPIWFAFNVPAIRRWWWWLRAEDAALVWLQARLMIASRSEPRRPASARGRASRSSGGAASSARRARNYATDPPPARRTASSWKEHMSHLIRLREPACADG